MKITFIYDIASPNAYLCHRVIPEFEKKHNVEIEYLPCLLGGIFKLTNNQPPWMAFAEITNKSFKDSLTKGTSISVLENLAFATTLFSAPSNSLMLDLILCAI